jgi:hypothetical protein
MGNKNKQNSLFKGNLYLIKEGFVVIITGASSGLGK